MANIDKFIENCFITKDAGYIGLPANSETVMCL